MRASQHLLKPFLNSFCSVAEYINSSPSSYRASCCHLFLRLIHIKPFICCKMEDDQSHQTNIFYFWCSHDGCRHTWQWAELSIGFSDRSPALQPHHHCQCLNQSFTAVCATVAVCLIWPHLPTFNHLMHQWALDTHDPINASTPRCFCTLRLLVGTK